MMLFETLDRAGLEGRIAIRFGERCWTYGDVRAEVDRLAGGLRAAGIRAGDRVGMMFQNRPENLFSFFACWRLGAVAVPSRPDQSGRNAVAWWRYTGASCVLVDAGLVDLIAPYAGELGAAAAIFTTGEPPPASPIRPWSALVERSAPLPAAGELDRDAPALIVQTSGTSATPKAVWFSQRAIDTRLRVHQAFTPATPDDVGCVFVAPAHVVQIFVLALPPLVAGGQLVIVQHYAPSAIVEELARRRVTLLGGPPLHMFDLLEAARARPDLDFSALRRVWTGADVVPDSLHREWDTVFATPLLNGYGLSETGAGVLVNPSPEDNRRGTVGRPFPTAAIRIVDPGGRDVPDGTPGELWCRCAYMFGGYWNAPELARDALVDGWLRTTDQAVRDPDGRYRILGRTGHLFKHRATFVSPYEVEAVLREVPAVADCLVGSVPTERSGREPEAFLVLREPITRTALDAFAASRLAESSCPVRFWAVDRIPYTAQGKVDRGCTDALRARATPID